MTWHPADERLDRWLALYSTLARVNLGEPDAGRRLRSWALTAGFSQVTCSASAWCYAAPEERAWWASTWADRVTRSSLADQALSHDLATLTDLAELAQGWRDWADHHDAWFAVLDSEVLAQP